MSIPSRGLYLQRTSFLHSLHPWTKLIYAGCTLIVAFLAPSLWLPLGLFAVSFLLMVLAGLAGPFFRVLLRTSPVFIALIVIQSLFYPKHFTSLFALGPLHIWREGLLFALFASSRLLAIFGSIVLLVISTSPADLVACIEDRGISHRFGYAILLILQIGPEMGRRVGTIMDAQKARAIEMEGNLIQRTKAFLPVLGPLVTSSFMGIETRALALEARGFSAPGQRTRLHPLVTRTIDRVAWWIIPILAVLFILYRIIM